VRTVVVVALIGTALLSIPPSPASAAANGTVLLANETLWPNQQILMGQARLIMQGDGNLVYYEPGWLAEFSSQTHGNPGSRLIMQGDGNLVVYSPGNVALWHSGTWGNPGAWTEIREKGDFVVRNATTILYDSATDAGNEGSRYTARNILGGSGDIDYYWNGGGSGPGANEWLKLRPRDFANVGGFTCVDVLFDWLLNQPAFGHRHYDARVARVCSPPHVDVASIESETHHDHIRGLRVAGACRFNPVADVRGHCAGDAGSFTIALHPNAFVDYWLGS